MAITAPGSVKGTERPDPKAANSKPSGGGEDRAGFDLGGSSDATSGGEPDESPAGSTVVPGGPVAPGGAGQESPRGRGAATSPGGPAGGSPQGETTQASSGGLRPPQTSGGDRTDTQGTDGDAV